MWPGAMRSCRLPHDDVPWDVLLFQRADCRDRDQELDAELFEAVDVGAEVELRREQAVTAAVPGEEDDFAAVELTHDEGVGRRPPGGLDLPLLGHFEAGHLVEAAAADHTDPNITHLLPPKSACLELEKGVGGQPELRSRKTSIGPRRGGGDDVEGGGQSEASGAAVHLTPRARAARALTSRPAGWPAEWNARRRQDRAGSP